MERKQIFGVLLGVVICIVMLFAGLYLTGQIGKKKNVVPAAAEVQTTETTDATMAAATAAETTAETTTVTTTTTVPAFKLGDVDGNGMIEVTDAVLVLTYYAKSAAGIPSTIDFRLADVNQDGKIDVADAVKILTCYAKQAAGLPPTF